MENSKNSWVCLGCASFQLTQCIILVIRCSRCSWVSRTVMVQCIIWPIPCSLSLLNILSHCITESASLHPYCLLSYSVLGVYILSRISSWKFDQEQFPTILLMQTQNTVCRWRFGVGSTAKRGYRLLTEIGVVSGKAIFGAPLDEYWKKKLQEEAAAKENDASST